MNLSSRLLMLLTLVLSCGQVAEAGSYKTWWDGPEGIYGTSVTPMDYRMPNHTVRAYAHLTSPTGKVSQYDTFYRRSTAYADVFIFVDWYWITSYVGNWYFNGKHGEVYCPDRRMGVSGVSFSNTAKLMSSATCVKRPPGSLVYRDCSPAYLLGVQTGWFCTYFPVDPCVVKCRADMYSIWVAGKGTIPAESGFMIRPWWLYPNGSYRCLKGPAPLSPVNCSKCWDVPV